MLRGINEHRECVRRSGLEVLPPEESAGDNSHHHKQQQDTDERKHATDATRALSRRASPKATGRRRLVQVNDDTVTFAHNDIVRTASGSDPIKINHKDTKTRSRLIGYQPSLLCDLVSWW